MKIRTSLSLLSVIFIILIIIIGFIMFHAFGRINEEITEAHTANKAIKDIFELNIVTSDYLIHHEKRMVQQWRLKYNSLGKLLDDMRKKDLHPEHLPICETMITDYKVLGSLFVQLQDNLAKREQLIKENRPQSEIDIVLTSEERLVAQSLMRSQRISAGAFKISTEIEQEIAQHQENANLLILFSIIGFAIFSSYISFLTIRGITRPISELMKGVEIIGKGHLEHRIIVRTKNEMGRFAVAFNEMIKKRKRAEEELKSANQQLQASEQQLKASNQQLRAGEQQLKASNQQLRAGEQELRASNQQLRANEQQLRAETAEREKANTELRRREERFRTLVENLPQKIFLKDKNSVYMSCNENYARDLKTKADEIVGKADYDFYPKELAEKYRADDKRIMGSKKGEDLEEKYIQDGQERWVHTVKTPVEDENGDVTGILGIFWDITERKKAEDRIRSLSSAVQQSPSIAVITDTDGNIEYVNPKFSQITGYAYKETIGKNPRILKSGETTLEEYKRMWDIITSGGEWRGIFHNKKKSGELYWEAASISSIKDAGGAITHFVKVAEDITERKKMEEETEKHLHDLEVFYKANIGREERVVELKKRVRELEAKLGKKLDNE